MTPTPQVTYETPHKCRICQWLECVGYQWNGFVCTACMRHKRARRHYHHIPGLT